MTRAMDHFDDTVRNIVMTRFLEHCDERAWSIVIKGDKEHCDDMGRELCDDSAHEIGRAHV